MNKLDLKDVIKYVETNIQDFHNRRLSVIDNINLKDVLRSKNPYLFKAKNITRADEIIEGILSAFISSSEEGIFGDWLEQLAIFINKKVYNGSKSAASGIDLEFTIGTDKYLVAIKSGPNWGNHDQKKKMIDNFNSARRTLRTSGGKMNVVCVNGCCYGRSRKKSEYKKNGDYYKVCGENFWELISGEKTLFTDIIEPLGHQAKMHNDKAKISFDAVVNKLNKEFLNDFSDAQGNIDWNKLVKFNSSF